MKRRVLIGLLISSGVAACGDAAAADTSEPVVPEGYLRALACRENEILVGANQSGAIVLDAHDQIGALRIVQVVRSGSSASPKVVVSQTFGIQGSMWATRLFWTQNDDLLVWRPGSIGFVNVRKLSENASPALAWVPLRDYPIIFFGNDTTPSQIEKALMIAGWGGDRQLLEFQVGATSVRPTGIAVGNSSAFVWDGGDLLARYGATTDGGFVLEVYRRKLHAWRKLHLPALPSTAHLLLIRTSGRDRIEVAFSVPGYGATADRLVLWREGASALRTIASGEIARIAVSPSLRDIFGYFRATGRFVPIADRRRPPEIEFWLRKFANTDGLIDFGFLDRGRVAMVKSHDGLHAAKVAVVAQEKRKTTRELYAACADVDRGVRRAASDGRNYVLEPLSRERKNLVVYLHGGPVNFIGSDGSWLTDVLTLSGHPVVVVNYTGSIGNWLAADEQLNLAEIFGGEVAAGIALAERRLGSKYPRPIIVANSFGSLVGLAAVASGRVRPSLFLGVDGVVAPVTVLEGRDERLSYAYLERYIARVGRDIGRTLEPANILRRAPDTRFVFIHGELDSTAPRADVERFVSQFNALHPKHPARASIVPGMFHGPSRKAHYDFVSHAIVKALATAVRPSTD